MKSYKERYEYEHVMENRRTNRVHNGEHTPPPPRSVGKEDRRYQLPETLKDGLGECNSKSRNDRG